MCRRDDSRGGVTSRSNDDATVVADVCVSRNLVLRNAVITIAIRLRYNYDTSTIRYDVM